MNFDFPLCHPVPSVVNFDFPLCHPVPSVVNDVKVLPEERAQGIESIQP